MTIPSVPSSQAPGAPPEWALAAGAERLGPFALGPELGRGGMGRVLLAWDPMLRRRVALKLLPETDPVLLLRFTREAQSQARVDHPNVCKVYQVNTAQGRPYIAMQYIEGRPLGDYRGCLSHKDLARILAQVAGAVHAAHLEGLVHRDLKPGNILLTEEPEGLVPMVLDFGLARDLHQADLTLSYGLVGTPAFMSPEQAQGEAVGVPSDVYSLGATLYAAASGRPPYESTTLAGLVTQQLSRPPAPLQREVRGFPRDLATIVAKCLELDPGKRYASAADLERDLRRWIEGHPIDARPVGPLGRLGRWTGRNPALASVLAAASAVTLALGAYALRTAWRSRVQTQMVQRFSQEAERMEASLRLAQMLPRHDTRPQRARLEAWMRRLEQEQARMGNVARGPSRYALGRGRLALGDLRGALEALQAAWAEGNRGPGAAAALAQVHAALLAEEREEANRISAKEVRVARLAELDRIHRRAARQFMELGRAVQSPEFTEALVAFLDQRFDASLQALARVLAEEPWRAEARILEAWIHLQRGDQAWMTGQKDEALRMAGLAAQAGIAAQAIAPSLEDGYLQEGRAHALALLVLLEKGEGTEGEDGAARAALDKALEVNPDRSATHVALAQLHRRCAEAQASRGEDPTPRLEAGRRHAVRATVLAPGHSRGWLLVAQCAQKEAQWAAAHGGDPGEAFLRGRTHVQKAAERAPRDPLIRNCWGLLLREEGLFRWERGLDPMGAFAEAVGQFREAQAADPSWFGPFTNEGITQRTLAEIAMARGEDPAPFLERSGAAHRAALALNPRSIQALSNLGSVWVQKAEWALRRGQDPRFMLLEAERSFRQAVEANPRFPQALTGLSEVALLRAWQARLGGQEPSAQAAVEARKALAANPERAYSWLALARAQVCQVEGSLERRGRSDGFAEAQASLRRAQALNPAGQEARELQARLLLLQARWTRMPLVALERLCRDFLDRPAWGLESDVLVGELALLERARHGGPDWTVRARQALEEGLRRAPTPRRRLLLDLLRGDADASRGLEEACRQDATLRLRYPAGRLD